MVFSEEISGKSRGEKMPREILVYLKMREMKS